MAKRKQPKSADADATQDRAAGMAKLVLLPSVKGASTIQNYSKGFGEVDFATLMEELITQVKAANEGDLKRAEAMLMVQAHTLDSIFNTLASRAIQSEYMSQLEPYLRLALKAQSQCRATLETLAAIKNPQPVAFVKQANIAHNQQVNNGVAAPSPARESEKAPNELLEARPAERLEQSLDGKPHSRVARDAADYREASPCDDRGG